jgi:Ca-activated chloride channel family protein
MQNHEAHERHEGHEQGLVPNKSLIAFVSFVFFVIFVVTGSAQSFRSRVDVVQVTVSVTDANGRLITGLKKEDFQIWEDGEEQEVTQFTDQRVPVSLGVLLDASDSMRGQPIVDARAALDHFVGDLLDPEDEAFVATFNHLPRLAALWSRPPAVVARALDGIQPSGGTAIYDALAGASALFDRRIHTRAAFIVISDGADTASDRTLHQAVDAIRRTDTLVYAIAIDGGEGRDGSRVNPEALREITSLSGGYTEVVRSSADLGPATARIADELNTQYTLGYSSTRRPDGSWRTLRVRVKRPDTYVRARRGYYSDVPRP